MARKARNRSFSLDPALERILSCFWALLSVSTLREEKHFLHLKPVRDLVGTGNSVLIQTEVTVFALEAVVVWIRVGVGGGGKGQRAGLSYTQKVESQNWMSSDLRMRRRNRETY